MTLYENLIASFIADIDAIQYVQQLEEDDFPKELRGIFRAIKSLYLEKKAVDLFTLNEKLPGSMGKCAELLSGLVSTVNTKEHVKLVSEKRRKNAIKRLAGDLVKRVDSGQDVSTALGNFVHEVQKQKIDSGVKTFREVGQLWVEEFEYRFKTDYDHVLRTGFNSLDNICHFKKGELIVLAARPSVGKSCFAANIADNIGALNKTSLILSFEMSGQQIFERAVSKHSSVNLKRIQDPKGMRPETMSCITKALYVLKKIPCFILHKSYMDIDKILFECENFAAQKPVDLLIVDYLQLIQSSLKFGSVNDKINDMTKKLKALALSLNVPVLLLSQLNRELEKRDDPTPRLSDLRDSGGIEQDADKVIFLHRDLKSEDTKTHFLVAKDRSGPKGEFYLSFNGAFQKFEEYDNDDE